MVLLEASFSMNVAALCIISRVYSGSFVLVSAICFGLITVSFRRECTSIALISEKDDGFPSLLSEIYSFGFVTVVSPMII
jgi:hypothetical protein